MSHPLDHPEICFGIIPAIRELMARSLVAVFRNLHTPYGIRNSGIGIRDLEKRQIMVRSAAFRSAPRKHWPECGSQESSWCGIFPLTP